MKKFTYLKDYTFTGTLLEENEFGYLIEFTQDGFTDTTFLEKEMTTVEEIETTIQTTYAGSYKGIAVEGKKYTFLVEDNGHKVRVYRMETRKVENKDSADFGKEFICKSYSWDINKQTLKGSGGLSEKVMKVVNSLI